jgi:hypothetical protein
MGVQGRQAEGLKLQIVLDQLDTGHRPQQLGVLLGRRSEREISKKRTVIESKIEMDTATHKPKRPAS